MLVTVALLMAAGADYVGGEEYINKIKNENWFDFDVCVTTPEMMGLVGRIVLPLPY